MLYTKDLSEPWFTLMKIKKKKIDGRLNKGTFAEMKVGDKIDFINEELGFKRKFRVIIKKINKYNNFNEFLENEELKLCLPGIDTINEGLKIYHKIYSTEVENNHNVLAIQIKKLKSK